MTYNERKLVIALKAMLKHYGPPASVAAQCEYDEDHPISLARDALVLVDAESARVLREAGLQPGAK